MAVAVRILMPKLRFLIKGRPWSTFTHLLWRWKSRSRHFQSHCCGAIVRRVLPGACENIKEVSRSNCENEKKSNSLRKKSLSMYHTSHKSPQVGPSGFKESCRCCLYYYENTSLSLSLSSCSLFIVLFFAPCEKLCKRLMVHCCRATLSAIHQKPQNKVSETLQTTKRELLCLPSGQCPQIRFDSIEQCDAKTL